MNSVALASYADPSHAWELRRVTELLSRKVPWNHIARQVGRNEITLRQLYDQPAPAILPPAPEPVPAPPAEAVAEPRTPKPYCSGKDPKAPPNQALVLMTWGEITVPELAERMDWRPVVAKAVMGGLVRGGFAERATRQRPFSTWRITDSGRAKLSRMTNPRGRPSDTQSLPNRTLTFLKAGETTNRKLAAHLKVKSNTAGWILGDLHRKGFVEVASSAADPRVWRITPLGVEKLGRARPWS